MSQISELIPAVRADLEQKFYLVSADVDDIELANKLAKTVLKDIYNAQIAWNETYIRTCDDRIKTIENTPNPHKPKWLEAIEYSNFDWFNKGGLAAYKARKDSHEREIIELKNKLSLIDLI